MTADLLVAQSLACERDDRALFFDLSFSVGSGDIVQVVGPNGAGKTTLLRIIAGLYRHYEGQLMFNGSKVLEDRSAFNESLLFIGHKSAINPLLTVYENLSFLCRLHGEQDRARLLWALDMVNLSGYEHVFCHNLSAGQQRRVALARLHLSNANLWVLDEVFTAIDLDGVAQLEQLLVDKAAQGAGIVFTTHHRPAISGIRHLDLLGDRID